MGTAALGLIQTRSAEAVEAPGQAPNIISRAPNIISRAQWGADESIRGAPVYDNGIKAAVVHHSADANDYGRQDSAEIVRAIYVHHTCTLGWSDIAYNALVDKYGQVFEGRFGGMTRSVQGTHTGGFNRNTWGACMIGEFDAVRPTPVQVCTVGRLLGWRLAMDGIDPHGSVALISDGGPYTRFPQGVAASLPRIFAHRDVGDTDCPGDLGYPLMDQIRDIAAGFDKRPSPRIWRTGHKKNRPGAGAANTTTPTSLTTSIFTGSVRDAEPLRGLSRELTVDGYRSGSEIASLVPRCR